MYTIRDNENSYCFLAFSRDKQGRYAPTKDTAWTQYTKGGALKNKQT